MTYGAFILGSLAITMVTALLFLNRRFGKHFGGLLWRAKWLVIIPVILYFVAEVVLGAAAVKSAGPTLMIIGVTMIQAVFFSLFQIFIMFWGMSRPQIEIYLPGDSDSELGWEDWIGPDSVKEEAQKMVASIANWDAYEANGSKPANGALFFGPPGTGKSLMARVIAAKSNMPVFIIDSSSLNGPFVAMGMLIVKSIARKIRKHAARYGGCVAFLDEVDAIGMARGGLIGGGGAATGMMGGMMGGGGGMGGNGTLQTLLTEMSGAASGQTWMLRMKKRWGLAKNNAKQVRRILWIAATNVDIKLLDPALVRSGRFGSIKVYFDYPTETSREQLFRFYLRKKKVSPDVLENWAQLRTVSRFMTGADIEEICEAAGRTAVYQLSNGERPDALITFRDLWSQIRIKKFGHPKPIDLHPEERHPVATHEAGHGVALVDYPPTGILCGGATLRPTEDFVAAVLPEKVEENRMMMDEEDLYRDLLISVNSRAAEELILNNRYSGVTSDLQQAMSRALQMVEICGMGEKLTSMLATGGTPSASGIKEAEYMVNATFRFAKIYTAERREAVVALATALDERTDLTGPEVIDIVKSFGAPTHPFIKDEIRRIMAEMKEEDKQKKINDMRAVEGAVARKSVTAVKPAAKKAGVKKTG